MNQEVKSQGASFASVEVTVTIGYGTCWSMQNSQTESTSGAETSYVPSIDGEFLNRTLLMDRYWRRIVGWDLQGHMQQSLVLAELPDYTRDYNTRRRYSALGYLTPEMFEVGTMKRGAKRIR